MDGGATESNSGVMRFVTNPVVVIFSLVLNVIAVVAAIYFPVTSRTSRDLVYLVHPVKTAVVRTKQSSKISIQLDGKPITRDVTAAQIAIWNNGKTSIRGEDLLRSGFVLIETGPENSIIEAKLLKASRGDVVSASLDDKKFEDGQVKVQWKILEQHDGVILQLIYFGDAQTPITASATIIQQGEIRAVEGLEFPIPWAVHAWVYGCLVVSLLMVGYGILCLRNPALIEQWDAQWNARLERWRSYKGFIFVQAVLGRGKGSIFVQAVMIAIIGFLMLNWTSGKLDPPFGF